MLNFCIILCKNQTEKNANNIKKIVFRCKIGEPNISLNDNYQIKHWICIYQNKFKQHSVETQPFLNKYSQKGFNLKTLKGNGPLWYFLVYVFCLFTHSIRIWNNALKYMRALKCHTTRKTEKEHFGSNMSKNGKIFN